MLQVRWIVAFAFPLLMGGCAAGPGVELQERVTTTVIPKDIGVARGAAMSALMRAGLEVEVLDASGARQRLVGWGDQGRAHVALEWLTPQSTYMEVAVLALPRAGLMGSFVDAMEGVLGPEVEPAPLVD